MSERTITPDDYRAALRLCAVPLDALAERAEVSRDFLDRLAAAEAADGLAPDAVARVRTGLESFGLTFPAKGVRLPVRVSPEIAPRIAEIRAALRRRAAAGVSGAATEDELIAHWALRDPTPQ